MRILPGWLTILAVLACGWVAYGQTPSLPPPVPEIETVGSSSNGPLTLLYSVKAPSSVKQGEVLVVEAVDTTGTLKGGKASMAGRSAAFFDRGDENYIALVSVDIYQKPGGYKLTVNNAKGETIHSQPVNVIDPKYPTQNISVSKSNAALKPLPGEMEAIGALKTRLTSTQFWEEPFITPTTDCQNSPFGVKRMHNGKSTGDYHKGVDLRSPSGRPIRATNAGKVVISKMFRLHGGTVGLDHGHGVTSIYIHMSKIIAKEGDLVQKGDVIGHVGSTGFATGPHLHWGMYISGLPVNPNQWVKGVPKC